MVDKSPASPKAATIREVARAAGVSLMTVSNVVNGRFHSMRAETRERVEKAIAELDYRPRGMARALRLNRELSVGILIVDPTSSFLADPFTSQVVAGLSNFLGRFRYGCLLHGVRPNNFDESIFLGDAQTSGLCVFLCGDSKTRISYLERLLALRKPIIAIGDTVPTVFPDVAVVRQDDFAAGREMIVRLLERGCVNFHVFKPETLWPSVTQRLEGIRQAVRDCDSSAVVDTISCNESSILKTERLLAGLAPQLGSNSCVIGATDRISTAISRIARSGDNPFRSETLFASFGASETSLDLSVFDVAVQSDPHRIGAEAGRLLLDRIDRNYFDIHESSVRLTLLERKDGR